MGHPRDCRHGCQWGKCDACDAESECVRADAAEKRAEYWKALAAVAGKALISMCAATPIDSHETVASRDRMIDAWRKLRDQGPPDGE